MCYWCPILLLALKLTVLASGACSEGGKRGGRQAETLGCGRPSMVKTEQFWIFEKNCILA